ncbi:unnamed protein product [Ambrosiozyma monospora]|uniref:Unnamed protein product n=1 Tax=Ambrosiozyma monospora TaxID=43982 RepID=A0ACB5T6L9_AMBMO|nr:unnamed protein product [Ambrosiozyma monospora]
MSGVRSVYQAYMVARGGVKVLKESAKVIQQDCSLLRSISGNDALFTEAKYKAEEAKAKANNRKFNEANVTSASEREDIDIFKVARQQSKKAKKQAAANSNAAAESKKTTSPPLPKKDIDPSGKKAFSTMRVLRNEENKNGKVILGEAVKPEFELSQSEVPSSRLSRLFHYGSLAAGVGAEVLKEGAKKYATGQSPSLGSLIMSPRNIERMAKKFSKMRGAALKIGQMMSFQDNAVLPPEVQQILLRVQNSAHYMPASQLEKTVSFELGDGWRSRLFASFNDVPIAAASIGQVHRAVTRKELEEVVVKVQYPGVADSIDSDLDNMLTLLTASRMLPPGLFLDKSVANARVELKWECDYIREATNIVRMSELLKDQTDFVVPKVYHDLSDEHILTMQYMKGTEIVKGNWNQETKDWIATQVMKLTLMEIYKLRFMQCDPNWANFLYNEETKKIELLDFGACREFGDEFVTNYVNCLRASVNKDRKLVAEYSKKLGFLTGLESEAMVNAHVDSILALGEPFSPADNNGKEYDFKNQTVTDRVRVVLICCVLDWMLLFLVKRFLKRLLV